jgi:hypothetical protein
VNQVVEYDVFCHGIVPKLDWRNWGQDGPGMMNTRLFKQNLRFATTLPTEDLPVPIIPIRYKLIPLRRGLKSLAGSILSVLPSSNNCGFLYGFSTPC